MDDESPRAPEREPEPEPGSEAVPEPQGAPDTSEDLRASDLPRFPDVPPVPPEPNHHPFARIALTVGLILALLTDGVLAFRLRDQQDTNQKLRSQLQQAQKAIADLQGSVRAAPGDPLQRIEAAVSQLRGLAFKRPVQPELLTPAEFRVRVEASFKKDNTRADVQATARVLATLGVIPPDVDLYKLFDSLQQEQIAGFYDSSTKKLVVRANDIENPSALDRVLLAHELTHALTDQWYDLSRLDVLRKAGKDDEQEAFLSLAEGDAQYTMQRYATQILTAAEQQQLASEFSDISSSQLDAAPKFIQDELGFPYTTGMEFVQQLHDRGGNDAVNRAYQNPPTSTEQIIHPARYLDQRDDPVAVTLPNVAAALGSGWHEIDTGGFGELDLRDVADFAGAQGLSEQRSKSAASGWDGGRYVGLGSGSHTVVAVQVAFDSESEAREAEHDFGDWLPLRYGNVGSEFSIGSGTGRGWESGKGAGEVLRSGTTMVLLLGSLRSDLELARKAFKGF